MKKGTAGLQYSCVKKGTAGLQYSFVKKGTAGLQYSCVKKGTTGLQLDWNTETYPQFWVWKQCGKRLAEILEIWSYLQDNMIMDQTSTHIFREILSGERDNLEVVFIQYKIIKCIN